MAKRQPFTFESNLDKIVPKIQDAPYSVMNKIGAALVKEIKATQLRNFYKKRSGTMDKSLQYWARKKERDLQIGFKAFYAPIVLGKERDPIKPVVFKNIEIIKQMIGEALDQIRKED